VGKGAFAGRAILVSTAVEEYLRVVCHQGREERDGGRRGHGHLCAPSYEVVMDIYVPDRVPLAGGELQALLVGKDDEEG